MALEKGIMVFNSTFNNMSVIAFSFIGRGWKMVEMVEIDRHPFLSIGKSTIRYMDIHRYLWTGPYVAPFKAVVSIHAGFLT
jgi:hypothetical protein